MNKKYVYFPFPWMIDDAGIIDWIRVNLKDYKLRIRPFTSKIKGVSVTSEDAIILKLKFGLDHE